MGQFYTDETRKADPHAIPDKGVALRGDDWPWSPAARTGDPVTSYEAEAAINRDGLRKTQSQAILDFVTETEGQVAGEIAEATGYGMHITSRRLADLKNLGLIRQGFPRTWEGSGRRQVTWWPAIEPEQGELL
tara:strand:- start:61 stop:459 length:399 start_codon:yes stop_codon:yes gene_type:complete